MKQCCFCGAEKDALAVSCPVCGKGDPTFCGEDTSAPAPEPLPSAAPLQADREEAAPGETPPPCGTEPPSLSVWKYFGCMLLFCVPLVGLFFMLFWGYGGTDDPALRNFARAALLFLLSMTAVVLFLLSFLMNMVSEWLMEGYSYYTEGYPTPPYSEWGTSPWEESGSASRYDI